MSSRTGAGATWTAWLDIISPAGAGFILQIGLAIAFERRGIGDELSGGDGGVKETCGDGSSSRNGFRASFTSDL
ncbi:hypothetical protein PENSPDRAFT_654295 [Peniophora sp. CONT]|nr:hypothetical protein PENSPDRAFT_654295 [Peniophora sp. CONT]